MIDVRPRELEAIINTIDRALNIHDAWRDRLYRTIICKQVPTQADLDEHGHLHCEFGKWFHSPANAHLREIGSFKRLGNIHEAMHTEARNIYAICHGHWVITAKEYDSLLDAMYQFRSELLIIRHKASETLLKIDALTGAFCSSQLLPDLAEVQATQKAKGGDYGLIRLKFDLLAINDRHGNEAGDRVLRTCLAKIKGLLHERDRIYRYTGADFIVCLPDKSLKQTQAIEESILATLSPAYMQALQISLSLETDTADAIGADTACAVDDDRPAKTPSRGRMAAQADEEKPRAGFAVQHAACSLNPDTPIEQQIRQATLAAYPIDLKAKVSPSATEEQARV